MSNWPLQPTGVWITMTTTINGWAAWELRALTAGGRSERRPMPRVRLGCEVMEGRLCPSTVLYEATETWTGTYDSMDVTSKVTEGAPGYSGKLLWEYHVSNIEYDNPGIEDNGLMTFQILDGGDDDQWTSLSGWEGYGAGYWATAYSPLHTGDSADFSFTTPDTAPLSTTTFGQAVDTGYWDGVNGFCAAPIQGVASVQFTNGPNAIPNVGGGVDLKYRWDNCNEAAKVEIEIVDNANPAISYFSDDFNTTQTSSSRSSRYLTSAPAGTKVKVTITVKDIMGGTIATHSDTVTVK